MKRFLFLFSLMLALGAQAQSRITRAETGWIHFLDPVTANQEAQKVSGTVMLNGKLVNGSVAEEIKQQLSRFPSQIASAIDITFFDTPSGGASKGRGRGGRSGRSTRSSRGSNDGDKSAPGLREVLMDRLGVETVTVTVVPEDWEGIIRVTQEQSDIRLKQAALDIMQHVSVQEGRADQLRALAGGDTWSQLQQQVFPRVQRIEYKAVLKRQPAGEVAAVTLDGLYATARNRSSQTDDYYDIIDLAARLFPESVEAAVNAAGVALLRGDMQKADNYLQPLRKDSRANLHLGVMYLMRGDTTQAEVFLRMAEAQGIAEATAALRALSRGYDD